tara:strand:- start:8539 stop:9555 length:1017 start_codon:yes stop_codon:yes gene_type:complete
MTNIYLTFSLLFLTFLLIYFLTKKYSILLSKFNDKHQKLIGSESIPLIGGLIIIIFISFNFFKFNNYLIIFSLFIFVVGILSDLNLIRSPNKRFIIQCFIILTFLYFFEYRINDIRLDFTENLFSNQYFKYFFTAFCLLILINGSNFIDGSNGLNLGYFLCVYLILQILTFNKIIYFDGEIILTMLLCILFLLILNLLNYLYLGDSGAYLLAFFTGSILIYIHQKNLNISPYFIALLLWYPVFENFFSIIRKKLNKIDPLKPDNNHLHQLIFKYIKNKKIFSKNYSNQTTSIVINIYNLIIFFISINFVTKTDKIILLIILNVTIYLFTYFYLMNQKN